MLVAYARDSPPFTGTYIRLQPVTTANQVNKIVDIAETVSQVLCSHRYILLTKVTAGYRSQSG